VVRYRKEDRVGIGRKQREIMASRKGESAGSVGSVARDGKVGKLKQEGQQSKLVTEEKADGKRMSFRLESSSEGEERLEEIKAELKTELRKRLKDLKEKLEKDIRDLKEEVKICKEYIEGHKNEEEMGEEMG